VVVERELECMYQLILYEIQGHLETTALQAGQYHRHLRLALIYRLAHVAQITRDNIDSGCSIM
jgi:hypothetical protein